MLSCPQCNATAPDGALFCPQCGASFDAQGDTPGNPPDAALGDATPRERFQQAAASRQSDEDEIEETLWSGSYSPKAMTSKLILVMIMCLAAVILGLLLHLSSSGWYCIAIAIMALWLMTGIWFVYQRLSTRYELTNLRFFHKKGFLWRTTDRLELIDIDDVIYHQNPIDRLRNTGQILLLSSDESTNELLLRGIRDVRQVADMIDKARRAERRRRGLHIESV
ncbi:Bacterial membrane flanked domain protein [Pseudobythopirellula maris]|uniref:Bacterial membrane flanked domain protein n=1 Tax=Pseudobythopirellula maris TaxID=2527991 RepID=A0A5C5ZN96_9BACT|nr:PH domain-containing protein [Pseudobythopirellula maris]TWT88638.1 Bacterial membrane flanked domain protein [Pseudobythopirellula maris]